MPRTKKYLVEYNVCGVPNCETVEDLEKYLNREPNKVYSLISVSHSVGNWILIWEKNKLCQE